MVLKGPKNMKNMGLNFFEVIKVPIGARNADTPRKSSDNLKFLLVDRSLCVAHQFVRNTEQTTCMLLIYLQN